MTKQLDDWYRPRSYRHFDSPCSPEKAREASSPEIVETHAFYPLIQGEKATKRYVKDLKKTEVKRRKVAYASHTDSHIYAKYAADLSAHYEQRLASKNLTTTALAYRKLGQSNIALSIGAMNAAMAGKPRLLLGFDLKDFFGSLLHSKLKEAWMNILDVDSLPDDHYAVFKSLTKYSFVDREKLFETLGPYSSDRSRLCSAKVFREKVRPLIRRNENRGIGIPQGLPISACLSNIYMLSFDGAMRDAVTTAGGTYVRYSDDILLSIPLKHEADIVEHMLALLKDLGLSVNHAKTMRRTVDHEGIFEDTTTGKVKDCFDYLGLSYDGTDVTLRQKTLARFHQKMARAVKKAERESKRLGSAKLLFGRSLIARFSHRGDRNFVRGYALNAADKFGLEKIRAQLARHAKRLQRLMTAANTRLSTANQSL